jgi:predicted transglutaminase-like cysteine proteinase
MRILSLADCAKNLFASKAKGFLWASFIAFVLSLPLLSQPVAAQGAVPALSVGLDQVGDARPISAWTDFCRRNPEECSIAPGEPERITMTPQIWRTLMSVNRKVNTQIKPMTDIKHWGTVDRWDLPTDGYGDCEDYQLLKRKILAESGLSRRAMRMTVVIDELREGHAVLMIRTDRGDFILDNKTNTVLPWGETGYVYVKREGDNGSSWASLGGVASPVATATR